MKNGTKKIGSLLIDTGKIILCDPAFLQNWKQDQFEIQKEFRDQQTGNIYTYGKDFNNFKDILLDHKSVNELIAEKRFERIPYDETGEFSNSAVNKGIINKGYVQCKFPTGFDGMAIAIGTDIGDGEVPVFAEFKDGAIKKLWIEFEEVSSPVP